ncbi:hypothetical protein SAMN06265365_10632 [Tistlia consotensis]|uniref:Uncharacterized protein n=1 Tax=Tistlia consotensis USBA 355 TaxID=560819 RepID=A0A1Y6BIJ0_9PROT|nr:hypothetical protein [Tistlia consotensis]SMF02789.1 hypothetical protein SAMN05428998_10383 [Tistlia consotensis USBA 355]SNR53078.1 hypothetical protein SAMN06265365_10632 [Tistlia consotensis]
MVLWLAVAGPLFGAGVLAFFWLGEAGLSPGERRDLARRLSGGPAAASLAERAQVFGRLFDGLFGIDALRWRFLLGAGLTSLLAVAFFFATFLIRYPVFADSLVGDSFQRLAVGRQLGPAPLLLSAVVDFLCLAWCREIASQLRRPGGRAQLAGCLLKDLGVKLVIFLLAMALLFLTLAGEGGFGGDSATALRAIPPTLLAAAGFRGLGAVYLYAALLSSFWLWSFLLAWPLAARAAGALARHLPLESHPARVLGLVAAALATLAYWLALAAS